MKGIINIGNSCYMNSGIQLLFNSTAFREISEETEVKEYIDNYDNNNFNPSNFKNILLKKTKIFNNTHQQDSFEFIVYLLDAIDNPKIHTKLYSLFGIESSVFIKCKQLDCLKEHSNKQVELFLNLPMSDNLDDSYRTYKGIEKMENNYNCEECKRKVIARKKTVTSQWPKNLIIVLKRFDHNMRKNNNKINIPLLWRHGYKLKGGIIHMGSYGGGHYIYYGEENGEWFIANDSHISKINDINSYINNEGSYSYILYYNN